VIVLDSSFFLALLDRGDANHGAAAGWYAKTHEELATTPLVLAEVDSLAGRGGPVPRDAFRRDLAGGAYAVDWWAAATVETVEVAQRYAQLGVSLTDASLVALAARLHTTRIATFDDRHFRAVKPLRHGAAFSLLPADA
jgi:predicted nucleic acid-binding protein